MRILNSQEQKQIKQLFQLNQQKLLQLLQAVLSKNYSKVIKTKEYLIAIGNIPVALSAHVDTVFTQPPKDIFYDSVKNVMWSPDGLGADDRAGVFAILQIIKHGFYPTIIFTTGEERGCLGAESMVKNYPKAITDLKYIIELDRRGNNDCVFYDCDNQNFSDYVEKFGFITNFGSFTDISVICPAWEIAGVNVSIGYFKEHSVSETLYIQYLFNTIKKVEKMLKDSNNSDYFKYIPSTAVHWWDALYPENQSFGTDFSSNDINNDFWNEPYLKEFCDCCGRKKALNDLIPVKIGVNEQINLCSDCLIEENISICPKCGECFVNYSDETFCQDCRRSN